jgi:ferrous iron transport protein B
MVALRMPLIALVGNPNTGKTTLFNALAGMNQRVGNYPGVTVETKKGKFTQRGQLIEIIDLPGTYSLAPRSPDEMLAVDVILGHQSGEPRPDLIVTIVDASNLERNLYLASQLLDLGVPVVIALNMIDVAQKHALKIDVRQLSQRLGVPVVAIQANRGHGLEDLRETIAVVLEQARHAPAAGCVPAVGAAVADHAGSIQHSGNSSKTSGDLSCGIVVRPDGRSHPAGRPTFPAEFECEVAQLSHRLGDREPAFLVRRLLLDTGGYVETLLTQRHGAALLDEVRSARQRLAQAGCAVPAIEARTRYAWIRSATAGCVERPAQRVVTWTDRLDRVLTHRFWGTLIFLGVMFLVFESIFYVARWPMDGIGWLRDGLKDTILHAMSAGPLRSLLADGVVEGVGSVLTFVPQIMILFAFLAVLEDCGYMARAAFLMDRLMARAGLNGKSFIPLLSSVACAVPGIMSARVIENRRDRLATILVAPLMSCSARLPVYTLLIGAFLTKDYPPWVPGLTLFGLYLIGLVCAPLMAFVLKRTLLRGETPIFVMEMPLYKTPSLRLIVRRACDSGWMFVRRAGTMILASMIVIWALLYFPDFDSQGRPFERRLAALDEEIERHQVLFKEWDAPPQFRHQVESLVEERDRLRAEWKASSVLGRSGRFLQPAFEPLGWDWRIGVAALASFPAREVMVGTLGILFNQGEGKSDDEAFLGPLGDTLHEQFTVPVALSVMVFFALCCQCVSTLAVIKRETNSWAWPVFTFTYMTVLAYLGAFVVYQVGRVFLA